MNYHNLKKRKVENGNSFTVILWATIRIADYNLSTIGVHPRNCGFENQLKKMAVVVFVFVVNNLS